MTGLPWPRSAKQSHKTKSKIKTPKSKRQIWKHNIKSKYRIANHKTQKQVRKQNDKWQISETAYLFYSNFWQDNPLFLKLLRAEIFQQWILNVTRPKAAASLPLNGMGSECNVQCESGLSWFSWEEAKVTWLGNNIYWPHQHNEYSLPVWETLRQTTQ